MIRSDISPAASQKASRRGRQGAFSLRERNAREPLPPLAVVLLLAEQFADCGGSGDGAK
jgi:hypothetical protein